MQYLCSDETGLLNTNIFCVDVHIAGCIVYTKNTYKHRDTVQQNSRQSSPPQTIYCTVGSVKKLLYIYFRKICSREDGQKQQNSLHNFVLLLKIFIVVSEQVF
jgi:hypothetical protein